MNAWRWWFPGILCLFGLTPGLLGDPAKAEKLPERTDRYGDPLPDDAMARLGTVRLRNGSAIRDAVFSEDGKQLLSVAHDGVVRVWETDNGKEVRSFTSHAMRYDSFGLLRFSPDARRLVLNDGWQKGVWDTKTGKAVFQSEFDKRFISDVFSCDGGKIAGLDRDVEHVVRLVDIGTDKEISRLEGYDKNTMLWTLTFCPDGKAVAARNEKTVQVWDMATGKELWKFTTKEKPTTAPLFSGDSATLVLGTEGGFLYFWDVATGKELRRWRAKEGSFHHVALSLDAKVVATSSDAGSSDGVAPIYVWEVSTGKELWQVPKPTGPWEGYANGTNGLGFRLSPDGKTLAVWLHTITLWDLTTGRERHFGDGHVNGVGCVTFAPDGQTLITGGDDRSIRLWKAESGRELHRFAEQWQTPVLLAASPDGKQLLAVGDGGLGEGTAIRRWDLADRQPLRSISLPGNYRLRVARLFFELGGKNVLATGTGDLVDFWDATTGKQIKELDRATFPGARTGNFGERLRAAHWVQSIAVSPERATLAIGGHNGVDLWSLGADKVIGHWNHKIHNEAIALAFHPDGCHLFVAWSEIGSIQQHELSTGNVVGLLEGHEGSVCNLVLSPDDRTLASGGVDGTVRLWELATGGPRIVLKGHRGPVFAIAFSADGKRLISGSLDTTALIWDLGRGADLSVKPATLVTAEAAERAWKQLRDGDAAEGERAIRSLLASPQTTLEMLHTSLKPLQPGDEKQLARWIADLDSEEFKVRDEATAKIEKLGLAADASLRDALRRDPSPELRRRIKDLLKPHNRDRIRNVRAVEVLEHLGTPEAREQLKNLAQGTPHASLTREAKASLERLEKQ